jgi:hypothetical protein
MPSFEKSSRKFARERLRYKPSSHSTDLADSDENVILGG